MNGILITEEYKNWLKEIKLKVRQAQIKAAVKVNTALLEFYWELGADIVEKQKNFKWGSGFLKQLSKDLMAEFPEIKGFSKRNLERIRKWFLFYCKEFCDSERNDFVIATQVVSQLDSNIISEKKQKKQQLITQLTLLQLFQIPWGHNIVIISKCKIAKKAFFYVNKTIENSWSRAMLTHQIESRLYERQGKAITNFENTLPEPQSDLAQQLIKDPYNFDFLTLTENYNERELENSLLDHITNFLLELGAGFAFIGKQKVLQVGKREFSIDLLFYHTKLHCYVVIELKTGDFQPEHAGKLNFYLKTVDEQIKSEDDKSSIGILLCKTRDKMVVEYALSDINKPMGVSEYQLIQSLPDDLKSSLPSIEEIESEFNNSDLK